MSRMVLRSAQHEHVRADDERRTKCGIRASRRRVGQVTLALVAEAIPARSGSGARAAAHDAVTVRDPEFVRGGNAQRMMLDG